MNAERERLRTKARKETLPFSFASTILLCFTRIAYFNAFSARRSVENRSFPSNRRKRPYSLAWRVRLSKRRKTRPTPQTSLSGERRELFSTRRRPKPLRRRFGSRRRRRSRRRSSRSRFRKRRRRRTTAREASPRNDRRPPLGRRRARLNRAERSTLPTLETRQGKTTLPFLCLDDRNRRADRRRVLAPTTANRRSWFENPRQRKKERCRFAFAYPLRRAFLT